MMNSWKRALQSPSLRGGLFYAAFWSVFGIINPFMNLELSRRGFSGLEIGTIGSIRGVVVLLTATVFARIADQRNIRVKMMRWFMIAAGLGVALFSFPKSFPWLVAATIFMAIWQSPLDSLGNSVLVRMASRYQVDYGMMTFWGAVAFGTMNLIGGAVWEKIGFQWIYIIGGVMYVVVSFIAGTLEEPLPEKEGEPELASCAKPEKNIRLKPVIILFLVGYLVFSLAFFNAFGFTGPILDMRGASEFVIGLVGTLIGIGGMIVRRTNQKLLTIIPLETAMILGILIGIIPIVVFGWVESVPLLLVSSMFRGAGWGIFSLCAIRFIDQQASVENASTLQSALIMLNTLANIFASTLAGYLFDTNPTMIFIISTAAACVALGILFFVQKINHQGNQPVSVSPAPNGS